MDKHHEGNVELAYDSMRPEHQQLLVCVAPFAVAAHPTVLGGYLYKLRGQPVLRQFPLDQWPDAIRQAEAAGLFRPHPAEPGYLSIPSDWTAILRRRPEYAPQTPTRHAIDTAFRHVYWEYADAVGDLFRSTAPHDHQTGRDVAHVEYENLVAALDLALLHGTPIAKYFAALTYYFRATSHCERGLDLSERVRATLERTRPGGNREELVSVIGTIAEYEHWLRRYGAADSHYHEVLGILTSQGGDETETVQASLAMIHHNLGLLAYDQQKWDQANDCFQEALTIRMALPGQPLLAETYHDLGRAAGHRKDYRLADEWFGRATDLFGTVGNRLAQAGVLADWAIVDKRRGRRKEAARHEVYKVGHHGSLNATPKSLWKMFKLKGTGAHDGSGHLTTLLTTLPGVHGSAQRNSEVPRKKLLDELTSNSTLIATHKFKGGKRRHDLVVEF